jgi:hypothetical protein
MATQLIGVYVTSVLPLSDQSLAATSKALFAAKNKFRHKPGANITYYLASNISKSGGSLHSGYRGCSLQLDTVVGAINLAKGVIRHERFHCQWI